MVQSLALLAILVAAANAISDVEWVVFKAKHKKVYSSQLDIYRRFVYEQNMEKIQQHNLLFAKGLKKFYLQDNEYADMTIQEFSKVMNRYRPRPRKAPKKPFRPLNTTMPDEIDWVKKGYVTEVKNQGECGSCWSFSATGSMEGAHFKKTGKLISLSEQNLMDCSSEQGNKGCDGGVVDYAFDYVIKNHGVDSEADYPYEEKVYPCDFHPDYVAATISSYKDVEQDSEPALQEATANNGPISVAIDASHESLQLYGGGVYDEPKCTTEVDHAVLVVGYGVEDGVEYWLVKNSWGGSWGLKGYVKMRRNNNNQCGIASQASYPIA